MVRRHHRWRTAALVRAFSIASLRMNPGRSHPAMSAIDTTLLAQIT
jgi:hypothetical protein